MLGSPIGEPLIIFGDRKVSLASFANWLSRRSNAVTVDFVNRLAGRAEKQTVVHCHGSVCASSAAAVDLVLNHNPNGRFEMLPACNNPNNSADRPLIGPCLHTIRNQDLMVPFAGFEDGLTGRKSSKAEKAASSLWTERPGFGGWGGRSTCS
jgi:hypothetical protein